MSLFDFFRKKNIFITHDNSQKNSFESRITDALKELEELGYFKYANQSDLEELKIEVYNSLKDGFVSTIWNEEKPYNSKDCRHYRLDNETLFEQDGFTDYLKDFEYIFNVIGLQLNITNHIEEWDEENESINHSITINDKEYIIFKNFKGYGWGEAAQRFSQILNDQLTIQKKDERIYLANAGNDGQAIVLTEAQFNLLDPLLKKGVDRPLNIEDWCKVMQVEPM